MAKTGRYIHEVVSDVDVNIDNAFGLGKQTDLVASGSSFTTGFEGFLESMVVRVKNIAGATKLTIKICHNTNGTAIVIPDTESIIALEVGSVVAGGTAFRINFAQVHPDNTFSVFYKLDAGTATIDAVELYWVE